MAVLVLLLAPKMVASAASPSAPKVPAVAVALAVALAASAAGLLVGLVEGRAAACSAAVSSAALAVAVGLAATAVAVLEGVEVASDSPKTYGCRCWRRGSCPRRSRPSLAPRHLASAHLRELAAPLLPRTDPSAASSAEMEEGSGAMGSGPDCCRGLEMEVAKGSARPRRSQPLESPKELCM